MLVFAWKELIHQSAASLSWCQYTLRNWLSRVLHSHSDLDQPLQSILYREVGTRTARDLPILQVNACFNYIMHLTHISSDFLHIESRTHHFRICIQVDKFNRQGFDNECVGFVASRLKKVLKKILLYHGAASACQLQLQNVSWKRSLRLF